MRSICTKINKPRFAPKFSWFSIILGLPPIRFCLCNMENALTFLTAAPGLSRDTALAKGGRAACADWGLLVPVKRREDACSGTF